MGRTMNLLLIAAVFSCFASGKRRRRKRGRVVGGIDVTDPKLFPFFGSFRLNSTEAPLCGGTILDKYHFLTAAHCDDRPMVSVGTVRRVSTEGIPDTPSGKKAQLLKVRFCKKHPKSKKHKNGVTEFDFKVCKLFAPLHFGEYVKPVVIGSRKEYADYVVTKKAQCYIVGTGTDNQKYSTHRKWVQKLRSWYSKKYENMVGIKTKYGKTIFAIEAEKGSGACNGDSGNGISILCS